MYHSKRILVVDDDEDIAWTLQEILEENGFEIDCFTDSSMALEKFKPNVYDLIILDIKMPDPNGFELYSQLNLRDPKIKTLFFTALSSVESYTNRNSKLYPLTGKRNFIKKPASNEELLAQIYSMIAGQQYEDYELSSGRL